MSKYIKLYIATTPDRYELPVAISETPQGLASLVGTTKGTVLSCISHQKEGRKSIYHKVLIKEGENE